MYKLNGDNDEMKPIKEKFRKYIEKVREGYVKGFPEYLKKRMMERLQREDKEFIESLKNKNSFKEIDLKSIIMKDLESKGIKIEPEKLEEKIPVSEIIEAKMRKFNAECEKKWGSKFK